MQVPWTKEEMTALTDIFKNIVHSEIEQKRQPSNPIIQPPQQKQLSILQEQNMKLAQEV